MQDTISDFLMKKPAIMRIQIAVFLWVIEIITAHLSAKKRLNFLLALEHSTLLILRRGVWGIRTLAFLGYYTRPETAKAIGYRAHPDGWGAR